MDTLIKRIEEGMTTERDARIVAALINQMNRHERALRWIAIYGTGEAAMIACRALAGEEVEAWTPAAAN